MGIDPVSERWIQTGLMEGIKIGLMVGREYTICDLIKEGMVTVEQAAGELGISVEEMENKLPGPDLASLYPDPVDIHTMPDIATRFEQIGMSQGLSQGLADGQRVALYDLASEGIITMEYAAGLLADQRIKATESRKNP